MNWLEKNFPNWKPTLGGFGLALCIALQDAMVNHTLHKSTIGMLVFTVFLAFVIKGRNVTGGNIPQTPEAQARAIPPTVAPPVAPPATTPPAPPVVK